MAIKKSNVKIVKQRVMTALEKSLIVMGASAVTFVRPLVPIDTGNLRSSITFATVGFKSDPETVEGTVAKASDLVTKPMKSGQLFVGTNVEYAPHQEFGTNRKGNNETRHGNRLKRRSFLRLGVFTHRTELAKVFNDTMRGLLK